MTTLQSRLELALENGKMKQGELAKGVGMTPAGMSKLLTGKSKTLTASHAFKIARLCRVDAEWLATGRGRHDAQPTEKHKKIDPTQEFEAKHIDLLRMYKRLPKEIRYDIRNMIQTLAAAGRENYSTWIRGQQNAAEETEEA
jgi:transcriptional regulator with XRE-family HTH domain